MNQLNLRSLGISETLAIEGESRVFPAVSPVRNPAIVILVDENHSAQQAIDQNARDVALLLRHVPNATVVLEHFPVGTVIDRNTRRSFDGSNFHVRLLGQLESVSARIIGGDSIHGLALSNKVAGRFECKINDLETDVLGPISNTSNQHREQLAAKKRILELEAAKEIRELPEQKLRSKSLIDTALAAAESRIVIINAGANHNTHILDNVEWEGSPICPEREQISFVRIRPTHKLRLLAAYYHWIDNERKPDQALTDWLWAEANVPGVN